MPPSNPSDSILFLAGVFKSARVWLIVYELFIFYYIFRLANGYRNTRSPRGTEWKREAAEPFPRPPLYAETDKTLHDLGITLLAILQVKLYAARSPSYVWIYRTGDAKTWVEVVFNLGTPLLVQFASMFADDAMIMTRYPLGEAVTTPMYRSSFARRSIETAYNYHCQISAAWCETHGELLTITTLNDIDPFDEIYRQKYRAKDYERLRRSLLEALGWGVLLASINGIGLAMFASEQLYLSGLVIIAMLLTSLRLFSLAHAMTTPPNALDDLPKAKN